MFQSLRYAIRSLLQAPGFTTIALVTLALAIGVNSSMYTLTKTLFYSDAPFPAGEQVFNLNGRTPSAEFLGFSKPEIDELRAHNNPAVATLGVMKGSLDTVALPGQLPDQMQGIFADVDIFRIATYQPLIGRFFTEDECRDGNDNVVLITEDLWEKSFGRNPDVLTKSLRMNGRNCAIIGVLPLPYTSRLVFGEAKFFRPLVYTPDVVNSRDRRDFGVMVRLKPEAQIAQALANFAPLAERWQKDYRIQYENYSIVALGTGRIGGKANEMLTALLLGLAASILTLACANLANLQMARANARMRDLAIRSALGANRWSLIKHQLTESVLLSVAGGLLGLLVAAWSNELIGSNIRIGFTDTLNLAMDTEVVLFNAAASVVAGIGFGLVPAWLASRTDINDALKSQARGSTGGRSHAWVRKVLVVGQVALSLMLLCVAGMMVIGLRTIVNERPSWDSERILTANVQISEQVYGSIESKQAFHQSLLRNLETIPGSEGVSISSMLPVGGNYKEETILKEDGDPGASNLPKAHLYLVYGNYFQTLGIPLLEGRTFDRDAKTDAPDQAIVNRSLARGFWPEGSAVGKRFGVRQPDGKVVWHEVIGVVGDAEDAIAFSDPRTKFQFYTPMLKAPWGWFQVAVRGENPKKFANDVRQAVANTNPDIAARLLWTVEDMRQLFLHNVVVINGVVLAFALLGLVIASVGLSGIVAQNVNQRLGEFGIRLALGALPGDLLRLVMGQGLRLTGVGVVIGLVLAVLVGKSFPADIAKIAQVSPVVFAVVALIITLVSVVATWIPARRATHADPMTALRAE